MFRSRRSADLLITAVEGYCPDSGRDFSICITRWRVALTLSCPLIRTRWDGELYSHLLRERLRGGFHLCSGSGRGNHLAGGAGDQLGMVKMYPVSAVARHQMSPARRELR